MFIWSFESQSTNICKHRKATNFNAMVTHKSVKQWQRFSLSRRQEYFKKFFQTILQETFTGSRHFASPVSWLMLASSSSSSLCTVCLWAVSSSCINWIARGKDWWDLWKQEPSICKSSKSAFSQPRYNLVQPIAAFYFKIFVQLKLSVQNLFQIAHYRKTWISTDTNSFGCWKQDIFFFLPLSLIPWCNIAANVCIKNISTCTTCTTLYILQKIYTITITITMVGLETKWNLWIFTFSSPSEEEMLELDDERFVERDDSLLDLKMILGSESHIDCV